MICRQLLVNVFRFLTYATGQVMDLGTLSGNAVHGNILCPQVAPYCRCGSVQDSYYFPGLSNRYAYLCCHQSASLCAHASPLPAGPWGVPAAPATPLAATALKAPAYAAWATRGLPAAPSSSECSWRPSRRQFSRRALRRLPCLRPADDLLLPCPSAATISIPSRGR